VPTQRDWCQGCGEGGGTSSIGRRRRQTAVGVDQSRGRDGKGEWVGIGIYFINRSEPNLNQLGNVWFMEWVLIN
jgi:hypothetical protein